MRLYVLGDQRFAVFLAPLVQPVFSIVNITVKKAAVIRIKHDLTNGGTRTFGHNAVHHAFTFCHPCAWKSHTYTFVLNCSCLYFISCGVMNQKKRLFCWII